MQQFIFKFILGLLIFCTFFTGNAMASSGTNGDFHLGDMLLQGRWGVRLETRFGSASEKFGALGHKEEMASDFDGISLDSSVVPMLAAFAPGATLGTTAVDSRLSAVLHKLTVGYGLTKDITVGFVFPFGEMKNKVSVDVSGGNLAVNPGFNPFAPISELNTPFVPVGMAGTTTPVDMDDMQVILTNPAFGYQYKQLGNSNAKGVGDPLVGGRWLFYKGKRDSAVISGGIRFGLSDNNDPDDLFDVPFDDGNTDLEATVSYYRQLTQNLDFCGRLHYNYQFSDSVMARAYADGESLVPISRKERLDREMGDIFKPIFELGYTYKTLRGFVKVEFYREQADKYSSPTGQDVSGLEKNTKREADFFQVGFTWNGLEAFKAKKAPLPFLCTFLYRGIASGENVIDQRNVYLMVTTLF